MATTTTTISVNAAFLQEIKEDHREYQQVIATCKEFFFSAPLLSPAGRLLVPAVKLAALLGELRDRAAMHFALEEAFGYFEDATTAAPWLEGWANQLRAEHCQLYEEIADLEELGEQLCYHETPAEQVAVISVRLESLLRRLDRHEAEENELIIRSLNEDIAASD